MTTPADLGWGPGWPNCQTDKWERFTFLGANWVIRREAVDYFKMFLLDFDRLIEPLDIDTVADDWSAACRAVRGSTTKASNHSWAMAVDLNSTRHPLGQTNTFSPTQMQLLRTLFHKYRYIKWGGDYVQRKDPMHFELLCTPAQLKAETARLKALLQEDDPMGLTAEERLLLEDIKKTVDLINSRSVEQGREIDLLKDRTKVIIDGVNAKGDSVAPGLRQLDAQLKELASRVGSGSGAADASGAYDLVKRTE